jgi:hypothetical protein
MVCGRVAGGWPPEPAWTETGSNTINNANVAHPDGLRQFFRHSHGRVSSLGTSLRIFAFF